MNTGRLIRLSALAKQWGWSVPRLHRLVKDRQIPHVRVGKRNDVFFVETELEAWLAARRVEAQTPVDPPTPTGRPIDDEFAEFGTTADEAGMFL